MESVTFETWHNVARLIYANKLLDDIYRSGEKDTAQLSLLPESDEREKKSTFYISDEIIDQVLIRGNNVGQGKYRIYEHFSEDHSIEENVKFLKSEYGIGGCSSVIHGLDIWEDHNSNGILLSSRHGDDPAKKLITYREAANRIRKLVESGRYLYKTEIESYEEWRDKKDNAADLEDLKIEKAEAFVKDGQAEDEVKIRIDFSEHPAFYRRIEKDNGEFDFEERYMEIPFSVANEFLGYLDMKQNRERDAADGELGYYHKTYFVIDAVINGEAFHYEGRYDLGDGQQNLIESIRDYYKYESTNESLHEFWKSQGDDYFQEKIEGIIEGFDVFLPFLENHSALSDDDRILLDEMIATETEWFPDLSDNVKDAIEDVHKKVEKQAPADAGTEVQLPDRESEQDNITDISDYRTSSSGGDSKGFLPKEKFQQNIQAIQILKQIESENRKATKEEQDILSRYVGWGGLADAFDSSKENWNTEYEQLRSLLDDSEYDAARQSTLTAFYTPPEVIEGIYRTVDKLGFRKGRILEMKTLRLIQRNSMHPQQNIRRTA